MGTEGAVGVMAQHIDHHLCPVEHSSLLAETKHLGGGQGASQIDLKVFRLKTLFVAGLQGVRWQPQQGCQVFPEIWPLALFDEARLNRQCVREPVGGQHPAFPIQQPATDGMAGNEANPVLIGHHLELGAMEQLKPGQPGHDGSAQEKHQKHEPEGLVGQTRTA